MISYMEAHTAPVGIKETVVLAETVSNYDQFFFVPATVT